jgi:hypothetical protein
VILDDEFWIMKRLSLRLAMPGVWLVEDQAGSWLLGIPGGTVDEADFASFKLKGLK